VVQEARQAAGGLRGQARFLEVEHAVRAGLLHQRAEAFVEVVGQFLLHDQVFGAEYLRFAVGEEGRRVVLDGGADQPLHALGDLDMRGAAVVLGEVHGREAGHGGAPAQRLEDFLLVVEVVVDVGLGHAELLHDLLHRGVGVALPVKQRLGGLEDALALLVRAGRARLLAAARLHGRRAQRAGRGAWCRFGYTHG